MKTMTAVLFMVVTLGGGGWHPGEARDSRTETIFVAAEAVSKKSEAGSSDASSAIAQQAAAQPAPDQEVMRGLPRAYPRPRSRWQSNEKAFYEKLLSKGQFDVLVVPFQVQLYALDRATRSLMTAQLAALLSEGQRVRVPDPYLVARALGDGERRYFPAAIHRLAQTLGVKRIVYGYVGHERNDEMRLTIQFQDRNLGESAWSFRPENSRQFANIAFTDETPPIEAYRAVLPAVLEYLGVDTKARTEATREGRLGAGFLASPLKTTIARSDPSYAAHFLQLLASLAPGSADRTRERFAEKSMLAISAMSAASPDYRLLKARALMQLGLRPAAIAVLATPSNAEEKHLFAVLNGNLPDAELHAKQVRNEVKALIAWLEVNAIRAAYGVTTQSQSAALVKSLKLPGEAWPFMVARAMTDWDTWSQHENIALKVLLDREIPIAGATAEELMRGAAALGDYSKAQTLSEQSVADHITRLLESGPERWCCAAVAGKPGAFDHLDLIASMATDNVVRRANFLSEAQGAPERALEYLARIESVYGDHPQVALARARAETALIARTEGSAREGVAKSAYANAFNAFVWEQGQTQTSADALHLLGRSGRRDFGLFGDLYGSDYPFRPYYPWIRNADPMGSLNAALRNSTSGFGPVLHLANHYGDNQNQWQKVDQLVRSLDKRFAGHPGRALLLAKSSTRQGDFPGAERHYRDAIAGQPSNREARWELGTMLFEQAREPAAAEVFSAYPEFTAGAREHPVAVSNYAFAAGSMFYWSGDFERALPFYRIAADLRTGSDASLSSATRIALVQGDLATAMAMSLDRARRYNSPYAYRDYLGMLHATGQSERAWDGFNGLIGQIQQPHVWETALVGHRLARTGEAEIAAWAAQDKFKPAGNDFGFASAYLLRSGVTDRMPTKELASRIAAMERPIWKLEDYFGNVVRPSFDGRFHRQLGPDSPHDSLVPSDAIKSSRKVRLKSDLVHFAEAYYLIRNGEYGKADAILRQAVSLFDTRNVNLGYLLPYYAYASARSGNGAAVQPLLDKFRPEQQRFDFYLARAIIAGVGGKATDALQFLKVALHRRPYTENRPLMTEYQFAEICEWVSAATRDPRIDEMLLDWAKANQGFQPWFAWPYVIEARLTKNPRDRQRAIALAHYLDADSDRLAAISKQEIDAAVKELADQNPFRRVGISSTGKRL